MASQDKGWDQEELVDYVDRLVELQNEMTELRKEAKGSGLQAPALNWLVAQRANNPADGGAEVVNELISYATALGMPLEGLVPRDEQHEEQIEATEAGNGIERVTGSDHDPYELLAKGDGPTVPLALRVAGECLGGLGLAAGLIWLLH
jgi:hypothetical protein